MSRQHSAPYLLTKSSSHKLEPVHDVFNENWLQEFIFTHSEALPIDEVEPVFGPLIAVCRELRTHAGPVDALFVNGAGLLTLVECKLWQNPEARRQVLGQILDYAKEISAWSFDQLETAIRASSMRNTDSLYQLVASQSEELGESEFIDSVSRNLKRGRFLLLVVGSGIRESVELLTDFLQRHAHLNFGLALVEMGIFKVPEVAGSGYIVLPRIVAQTEEVVRAVIRIDGERIIAEAPPDQGPRPGPRRKISEEVFYEALAKIDPRISAELRNFLDKARTMGLTVEPGDNSLKLKFVSDDGVELNLGIFRTNGTFLNRRIAALTEKIGHPEIGETYLTRLAELFEGGDVMKPASKWVWTVKKGNNQDVAIADCLAVQERWLAVIQDTIDQFLKAQENEAD